MSCRRAERPPELIEFRRFSPRFEPAIIRSARGCPYAHYLITSTSELSMIHPRFAPIVFGFVLSGLMSLIVSGIATIRAVGLPPDFLTLWMGAWIVSWAVAFPTVLVVAPVTRKVVGRLVRQS
jgi:hypothetical protein